MRKVLSIKLFVRSGKKQVTRSRLPVTRAEKDDTSHKTSVPTPLVMPIRNLTYPVASRGPKPGVDEDIKMATILKLLY